jgi:hypothetical protein
MVAANGSSVVAFMSYPSQSSLSIGGISRQQQHYHEVSALSMVSEPNEEEERVDHTNVMTNRRSFVTTGGVSAAAAAALVTAGMMVVPQQVNAAAAATAADTTNDFIQKYDDFRLTDEGWQYKDVKLGVGNVEIQDGDRVVFDWSGYTIGYFGRPFQAKGYVFIIIITVYNMIL